MFGERFKSERKRLHLTQEQIAHKLNISRSNVANWENNTNMASPEMILKCAELFDCSTDYLLGKSDTKNTIIKLPYNWAILNEINKDTVKDLKLDDSVRLVDEIPDEDGYINKIYDYGYDILLEKLKSLKLFDDSKKLSDKEINTVIDFIENNKDMLKIYIDSKRDDSKKE